MYVFAVGVVSNVIELLNISTFLEVTVIVHPDNMTAVVSDDLVIHLHSLLQQYC